MAINCIFSIFLFRNPDEAYVYAYYSETICLYVGQGRKYRATEHLRFHKDEKPSDMNWAQFIEEAKLSVTAINRVWRSGRPLTLFVSFVKKNIVREVEASLIGELKPSANKLAPTCKKAKEITEHFRNPTFASKLFFKVTNNELIII